MPVILSLRGASPRAAWALGSLTGAVFYGIGLRWLPGIYGIAAGAGVIVALSLWMGFALRIAVMAARRFGPAALFWAVPVCFTAQECIRSEGLPLHRFSQLGLGYSQIHNLWIAQIASLGGVFLITFLLAAVNAAAAHALLRRTGRALAPAAALAVIIGALGAMSQPRSYDNLPRYTAAAIQDESYDYGRLLGLAKEAACGEANAEFIVFPEHTIAEAHPGADERLPMVKELTALSSATGAYVSIGAHTAPHVRGDKGLASTAVRAKKGLLVAVVEPDFTPPSCPFDNANLLVGPTGLVGKQLKSIPMPFWPDGNPASGQKTFATPHGRVGLYVCYDESFTDILRRLADKGAGLFLGTIYNGLDWPVQQRMQQADMMAFRAIELRRCMVRAASSGVSQIIEATGQVQAQRSMSDGPGVLRGTVYFNTASTFFARWGHLFSTAVALLFLAAIPALTLWPIFLSARGWKLRA